MKLAKKLHIVMKAVTLLTLTAASIQAEVIYTFVGTDANFGSPFTVGFQLRVPTFINPPLDSGPIVNFGCQQLTSSTNLLCPEDTTNTVGLSNQDNFGNYRPPNSAIVFVVDKNNGGVDFTFPAGALGSVGVYQANGTLSNTGTLTVTQTSTALLTITSNSTLPQGAVGTFYTQSLMASGGVTPYSWSLISGALPSGLSLSSAGAITGTPTAAGTLSFTARVTDAASSSATQTFSLTICTCQTFTSAFRVPHINDGAGWTTRFSIINTDQVPVTFAFHFWGDNGGALPFPILNGTPGVLSGTLAPGASSFVQSSGTSSTLQWGWAEVASSGKIGVTAVLQFSIGSSRDSLGSEIATQSGNSILMPFDNTQGNVTAVGVANSNPAQSLTVSMLFETDGGAQSSTSIVLPPHGHQAFVVPTINPAVAGFRGSIQFTAPSSDIAVMGLEFTAAGAFTSLGTFQ